MCVGANCEFRTQLSGLPASTPIPWVVEDLSGELLAPAVAKLMDGLSPQAAQLVLHLTREAAQLPLELVARSVVVAYANSRTRAQHRVPLCWDRPCHRGVLVGMLKHRVSVIMAAT